MSEKNRQSSPWVRTGTTAVLTLLGTALIIIACVGFISFLWYGTIDNSIWQRIILSGWATRGITLTSTALRTAVSMQGAVCLSMLAAVVLEKSSVPVASVGTVSLMRAGSNTGLVTVLTGFVWPMVRKGPRLEQFIVPTVLLILTTVTLSQFVSTALLSDVTLGLVPGYGKIFHVNYDFSYQSYTIPDDGTVVYGFNYSSLSWTSLWATKVPTLWPTFAEHSDPPIVKENVSDTGPSLRAFLPLTAEERPLIRNYSGKAVVLDSRVTCQQPVLSGLSTENQTSGATIIGNVKPSTSTPRLDVPSEVPFACLVWFATWSVCELDEFALASNSKNAQFSGGLVSQFREFPLSPGQNKSGAAFLLISAADITMLENRTEFAFFNLDLDGFTNLPLAATLCYTSLDTADRWIDAYSDVNRTEATPAWGTDGYNLTAIAAQVNSGYATTSPLPTVEERGVMRFRPASNWAASQSNQPSNDAPTMVVEDDVYPILAELPFLTWRLHLSNIGIQYGVSVPLIGNYTAVMGNSVGGAASTDFGIVTDLWLAAYFNYFMANYSSSVALQAVITALAGIEYADRLQQFDKSDNVSMTYFVSTITPGGPLGQRRTATPWGFFTVIIVLVIHTLLVVVVTARFLIEVSVSRIGDNWQAIAQVGLSDVPALEKGLKDVMKEGAERDVVKKIVEEEESNTSACRVYVNHETGTLRLREHTVGGGA
jgi:hypothetical protein